MLNIGKLEYYVDAVRRNQTVNGDGSVIATVGDEYTSIGHLYSKQIPTKYGTTVQSGGQVDTNSFRWLVRYKEIISIGLNVADYFKYNGQFYKVTNISEAVEYGRSKAAYIDTTIMNRQGITG